MTNSFPEGSFTIPIPAGFTYYVRIEDSFHSNHTPSNLNLKFLVGPSAQPQAGDIFIRSASINPDNITAGLTGLHAAIVRPSTGAIIGFVPQFIVGEAGDRLQRTGLSLFADEASTLGAAPPDPLNAYYLYLFGTAFQQITRVAMESSLLPPLIRTHLHTDKFYVLGRNSGSSYAFATVSSAGVKSAVTTIGTAGGSVTAMAASADEAYLYLGMRFSSGGSFITKVGRWDIGGALFASDLFADGAATFSSDVESWANE